MVNPVTIAPNPLELHSEKRLEENTGCKSAKQTEINQKPGLEKIRVFIFNFLY
jgi:hypothetical protein